MQPAIRQLTTQQIAQKFHRDALADLVHGFMKPWFIPKFLPCVSPENQVARLQKSKFPKPDFRKEIFLFGRHVSILWDFLWECSGLTELWNCLTLPDSICSSTIGFDGKIERGRMIV